MASCSGYLKRKRIPQNVRGFLKCEQILQIYVDRSFVCVVELNQYLRKKLNAIARNMF